MKPRMQRVDDKYLSRTMHKYLTDAEWKELSDKLCTREFEEDVKNRTEEIGRIVTKGPSL